MDLHELNYPSKYELFFRTTSTIQYNDISKFNRIETWRGWKKYRITGKSDSIEPSQASFLLPNQTKGITATWVRPYKTSVPDSGEATTHMSLKALDTAATQQYTLPIEANMPFASRDTNEATGRIINNINPTNITANSHITVIVLPKLDPFLKLLNNLTVWISPLSSIWTFLAAVGVVIIPFVIRMFNRNQNKISKYKKIDDFSPD